MALKDVLFGIAVADGVGNPLEFSRSVSVADFNASFNSDVIEVSDDTQMSLFCASALWAAGVDVAAVPALLQRGYLDWLLTQRTRHGRGLALNRGGLLKFDSLFNVEAPGRTCLSALSALASGVAVVNDSKGNGTVMRCAPVAYWAIHFGHDLQTAYNVAAVDAELTHKHRYAALCSKVLTGIHYRLSREESWTIHAALDHTLNDLASELDDHLFWLLSGSVEERMFKLNKTKLGGWVAEEALALALGAVACTDTYDAAIREAITIGGDSDTVGGIAGGLAAALGREIHPMLVEALNVKDAIDYVVDLTT